MWLCRHSPTAQVPYLHHDQIRAENIACFRAIKWFCASWEAIEVIAMAIPFVGRPIQSGYHGTIEPPRPLIETQQYAPAAVPGIALATLAQSMDGRMISGLMPTIEGGLALTPDEGAWLLIAYLCASIIVLPLSPWLSGYFGRRTYFLASIAGFGISALLCASATSIGALVLFRVLQGAFGGGLIASSHAALRTSLPPSHLGTSQVAFIGSYIGAPLTLGPLISGIITDGNYYWQWMFVVDAAIAALSFALCWKSFKDDQEKQRVPGDPIGVALFAGFVIPLQYLFIQGERYNWLDDPNIVGLIVLCVLCLAGLIWWHTRSQTALFSEGIRAHRSSAVVALLIGCIGLCLSGGVAVALAFAERLLYFTGTLAGSLLVVRALAFLPLTVLMGVIMDKRSPRAYPLVVAGLVLFALGFALQCAWATTDTSFALLVKALIVSGLGIGPAIVPLLWWLFREVPQSRTLAVTALVDTALVLGTTTAQALVPTALDHRFAFHSLVLSSNMTLGHLATATRLAPSAHTLREFTQFVTQQSYALAFADVALVLTAIALISLPLVALLRKTDRNGTAAQADI